MAILVENISKNYGSLRALRNLHLEIPTGSLTALVGPSGSGKSTLLRRIAGFETPDTGRIWLDGHDVTNRPPAERELGVVFQSYALFPYLTVAENIGFGLAQRGRPANKRKARVKERLNLVRLQELGERYPSQLSGGQRQRVALARALALEPRVLLLDEPFAALDPKVRADLRDWLRHLHKEVSVTTLLVTHDQQEAREVADQRVVFRSGRAEQVGSPTEIYDRPANGFVRGFVGHASPHPLGEPNPLLRPHGFEVRVGEQENKEARVASELERISYGETLVHLEVLASKTGSSLRLQVPRRAAKDRTPNSKVWIQVRKNLTKCGFPKETHILVDMQTKTDRLDVKGEVSERFKVQIWNVCFVQANEGSNPSFSENVHAGVA